jgi:hypothetical protein
LSLSASSSASEPRSSVATELPTPAYTATCSTGGVERV